ncbi:MAG: hypothetical protein IJU76_06665 [Desulfovibrionaceae bacterium]|nr:hypothetical protein [Desulfovibrionaceae bacterium]
MKANDCAQDLPTLVYDGPITIHVEPIRQGRDLLVRVFGGEAHIGAVAVQTEDGSHTLYVYKGHKEGELALDMARALAPYCPGPVCVVAGIHKDNITAQEIDFVLSTVKRATETLVRALRAD